MKLNLIVVAAALYAGTLMAAETGGETYVYHCFCQIKGELSDCVARTFDLALKDDTATLTTHDVKTDAPRTYEANYDSSFNPRKNHDYYRYTGKNFLFGGNFLVQKRLLSGGDELIRDLAGKRVYGGLLQTQGDERESPQLYLCTRY